MRRLVEHVAGWLVRLTVALAIAVFVLAVVVLPLSVLVAAQVPAMREVGAAVYTAGVVGAQRCLSHQGFSYDPQRGEHPDPTFAGAPPETVAVAYLQSKGQTVVNVQRVDINIDAASPEAVVWATVRTPTGQDKLQSVKLAGLAGSTLLFFDQYPPCAAHIGAWRVIPGPHFPTPTTTP